MAEALPWQTSYVQREFERQQYQDFLTRDTSWLMLVTGLGGSGKSEFLFDLTKHPPADSCVILLDFAIKLLQTDALSILEELSWRIEPYCDEPSISAFKNVLRARRSQLAELSNTIIQEMHLGANATSEGAQQIISIADLAQERRQQIWSLVTEAFYTQIDSFALKRLVIMLDNGEWISEPDSSTSESRAVGQWLMDVLIPGIHTHMLLKRRNCSVVIASSMPLSLNIHKSYQQHCNLDRLDKTAVDSYLELLGMQDTLFRQRVYDSITYGHAACVWIVGELWHTYGPFTLADLPQFHALFKAYALKTFIHKHILDKHLNSFLRELIHYGVLLRSFDQSLLQAVFPECLPETEAFQRFQKLLRYPYVKYQRPDRYTFLDLMRDILTEYIREQEPKKWQDYHRRALEYLTLKSHLDRYYHALACNETHGMSDWKQAVQEAYIHRNHEQLRVLFEVVHDKGLKLTLASCAERAYQQGCFYAEQKQWEAACKSYQEALSLFQQMDDSTAQIQVRKALDDVEQYCSASMSGG